jgi:hypothetical protein
VKGKLDGRSKLKICVKRGGDADELATFKCTFPAIVSVQEYLGNLFPNPGFNTSVNIRHVCCFTTPLYSHIINNYAEFNKTR